jgi:putative exosortase-associated protein (TIGR04073 family)
VNSRAKQIIGLIMIVVLLSTTLPAYAQYTVEKTTFPGKRQLTKLGRGLANLLLGWGEIPKEVYVESQEKKPESFGSIFVEAPVVGFGKAVGRTAVGIFETLTFFLPMPGDYAPIVEPEFVF